MWKAKIYVSLKDGILDPQGTTVKKALNSMGYRQVEDVRIGKYMEVLLQAPTRREGEVQVEEMCRRLLANPVIEKYAFELTEVAGE